MKQIYPNSSVIAKLNAYFDPYCAKLSKPTAVNFFWLMLAIIVLGCARSVRFMYEHFLRWHRPRSLNAYYYSLSYAKHREKLQFWQITEHALLKLIPHELRNVPICVIVDDTLCPKWGKHFEHVKTLFDHADHDGRPYKTGHCFVTIMMAVPVGQTKDGELKWLAVPLQHRMWVSGGKSKLEIAKDGIEALHPVLDASAHVILLFDSWYAKQPLLSLREAWPQLDIICAVRIDTAMYGLPPARTGKRGRPRKRGERIRPDDIALSDFGISGYKGGSLTVLTKLFGDLKVTACVTKPVSGGGTRRLYLSTITPEALSLLLKPVQTCPAPCAPVHLYMCRWNIETCYLQIKAYWDLCSYRVRSAEAIELLINIEAVVYSAMLILPYLWSDLSHMRDSSPQEVRMTIGRAVQQELFFGDLLTNAEKCEKRESVRNALRSLVRKLCKAS